MTTPQDLADRLEKVIAPFADSAPFQGNIGLVFALASEVIDGRHEIIDRLRRSAPAEPSETSPVEQLSTFIKETMGDPDRSEFHRGWHSCCSMLLAALEYRSEFAALRSAPASGEMRTALAELVEAVKVEVDEKGAGGYLLARLSDAQAALRTPSGETGEEAGS